MMAAMYKYLAWTPGERVSAYGIRCCVHARIPRLSQLQPERHESVQHLHDQDLVFPVHEELEGGIQIVEIRFVASGPFP